MGAGSGLGGQFGIVAESTYGTATAVTRFFRINSETLTLRRTVAQSRGLRAGARFEEAATRAVVAQDAGGDVEFDLPTKGLGLLLKHMIGSPATTATQQGATTAYLQTHVDGSLDGMSFTAQKGAPDTSGVSRAFTYPGCKIDTWELDCAQNDIAKLKLTIDAQNEKEPGAGALALQAASFPASNVFTFLGGSIKAGGTASTTDGVTTIADGVALAQVRAVNLKGDNQLKTDRWFIGGTGLKAEPLENDFAQYSGQLSCEFASLALYDAYLAEENVALQLSFRGPLIASTYYSTLDFVIPAIRYEDGPSPQLAGPDIIMQTAPFKVLDDGSGTNPRIQAQYVSTDAAP